MSPTVNNFVHDLVAMAKAMEDLPQVQAELAETKARLDAALQAVQDREVTILTLKDNVQQYIAKVRSTEAERDDAEMRFLELDEKAHKVLGDFEAIAALVNAGKNELAPPKPEPEAQHEEQDQATQQAISHIAEHGEGAILQGQSEPLPQTGSQEPSGQSDTSSPSHSLPVTSFEEVPKSDANPTAMTTDVPVDTTHSSANPTDQSVSTVDDVGYHNEPNVGNDWNAWNAWCERMRQRYGTGAWPQRPDKTAPSVA